MEEGLHFKIRSEKVMQSSPLRVILKCIAVLGCHLCALMDVRLWSVMQRLATAHAAGPPSSCPLLWILTDEVKHLAKVEGGGFGVELRTERALRVSLHLVQLS